MSSNFWPEPSGNDVANTRFGWDGNQPKAFIANQSAPKKSEQRFSLQNSSELTKKKLQSIEKNIWDTSDVYRYVPSP